MTHDTKALIARLETLTGPDREVDAEIWLLVVPGVCAPSPAAPSETTMPDISMCAAKPARLGIEIIGSWSFQPMHDNKSRTWRSKKRIALAEAQNWRCAYCGVTMDFDPDGELSATVDHVFPRTYGGLAWWINEVAACWNCNHARGCSNAFRFFTKRQQGRTTFPTYGGGQVRIHAPIKQHRHKGRQMNEAREYVVEYINTLRALPTASHIEIDAVLARANKREF